jgi:hypothetical protein
MSEDLEKCLIRICDKQGNTRGTGFIVSDSLAVTCAHVVEDCGMTRCDRVHIIFYAGDDTTTHEAGVISEFWRPPCGDDIAVLRLLPEGKPLPKGVFPAELGMTNHCNGHEIETVGFAKLPGGYELAGASGKISRLVQNVQKQEMIQMDAAPILKGMSGAPVLDLVTQRVVGMVSEYLATAPLKWATRCETIRDVCPLIKLNLPVAVQDYLDALIAFCNNLPYVSLRSDPDISLRELYVQQNVRLRREVGQNGVETAPESWASPMSMMEAMAEYKRIILIGEPGSGKSSLLRYLALKMAEDADEYHQYLPILVSLRGLAEKRGDINTQLREQISEELGSRLSKPLPENFLHIWSEQTGAAWVIALDGLDEVLDARRRDELVYELAQTAWPPDARVLITTRPVETSSSWQKFTTFEILPFEAQQISEFARNWLQEDETVNAFLENVKLKQLYKLNLTPLILTVATAVFARAGSSQFRRSSLYNAFVNALLEEDTESEHNMRDQFCEEFGNDLGQGIFEYRREVLECLALALLEEKEVYVSLREFLPEDLARCTEKKLMAMMEILAQQRTGLVAERGGQYEFIHSTFRDYLAASKLVRESRESPKRLWQKAISPWKEEIRQELVLFALGILSDQGKDVTGLIDRIRRSGERGLFFAAGALSENLNVADDSKIKIRRSLVKAARNKKIMSYMRVRAIELIGKIGELQDLIELARDKRTADYVRVESSRLLGEMGHLEEATSLLLALVHEEEVSIWERLRAAEILHRSGSLEEAVQILLPMLSCKDVVKSVKVEAATLLGKIGQVEIAADALLLVAKDETAEVWERLLAVESLLEFHRVDTSAEAIRAMLHDTRLGESKLWTRGWTFQSLPRVLSYLEGIAREDLDAQMRQTASDMITQICDIKDGYYNSLK